MRTINLSLSLFLALGFAHARQQGSQIQGEVNKGSEKPFIAVPDFRATGATAPNLMAVFNSTVQTDLQSSPLIKFVPKTLYPLRVPQVPTDLAAGEASANARPAPTPGFRLADLAAPPARANYLGIGYGARKIAGPLWSSAISIQPLPASLQTSKQAQILAKVYTGSLDESALSRWPINMLPIYWPTSAVRP